MNLLKNEFLLFYFRALGYDNDEDFINNLILKSIIDAFSKIIIDTSLEEQIRDILVRTLETKNEEIKELLNAKFLFLDTERRKNISDTEKVRTDISFSTSGFEFVLECKTLKFASKKYLEEGLQRFIDLKYAANDNFAGMLGFIIAGNPENIVRNLKKKVKTFHPAEDITQWLDKKCLEQNLSFQSKHIRSNETKFISSTYFLTSCHKVQTEVCDTNFKK